MKYHHNSTVYRYLLLSKLQLRLCSHLDSCEVLREESEEDGHVCLLGDQTPLQTGIHLLLCVVCVYVCVCEGRKGRRRRGTRNLLREGPHAVFIFY